jgi:phage terminase large subunit-like protein
VRDACKRHLTDLAEGHKRGLTFDIARANHALNFFPTVLRLNGGQFEGKPFELQPAQAFIVGSLFGWVKKDGTRRFRFAYIEQGKGNGKSPLVAGIGLYGMTADNEPRAEVYAAATKKDQAMILFRDAVAMVEQSPALKRAIHPSGKDDKVWNLFHGKSNSFFRPISADDGQSGPRPHIGLVDELHEHKSGKVINMLAAGRKWRRQPMIVAITNSGHDRNSVCWEYRNAAIQVNQGSKVDDAFFGYVCALDEGEDPFTDESCWIKANPLLGTVITEDYLRSEIAQARGMPSKESLVRRLNFCEWTESHDPLVSRAVWEACQDSYTLADLRGMECIAALDLSATTDLTAAVLLFRKGDQRILWPMFWLPKELIVERAKADNIAYDIYAREGLLRTTPGRAINKDFVADDIARVAAEHDIRIQRIVYDRWRIEEFKGACERADVQWDMEPFGQGYQSMAPAVDAIETAMVEGRLRHPGHPLLTNHAANATVESDRHSNRKLIKDKATGRIDGFVAATMAIGADAKAPVEPDLSDFLSNPVIV